MGVILTRYEKASKLKDEDFKQLFGIKRETFDYRQPPNTPKPVPVF
jgi:hypothetical protein